MFELYTHQEEMSEPIKEKRNTYLRAPCGSGKTLAVVYNWLEERPTLHLIYVLPTKTLLRGIERDIKEIVNDKDLPYNYVKLEEKTFSDSTEISIAADYGERRETSLYAHDIILTTLDSYVSRLYRSSLTPRRYRDLPIARILNSTSVFDEAHMYDNYTHTLMRYVLEFLRGGEAHHVVMTATMNEKMVEFLGLKTYHTVRVPPEHWLDFTGDSRLEEIIDYESDNDLADEIEVIIGEKNIRKALIVCNTVRKAQNVFKKLQVAYNNNILLHSRFKLQDRNIRENEALDISRRDEGFIVSTQVVEAGLNISFPNLITDISPGDSLVQRIGRCARKKNEKGRVFIMCPRFNGFSPYSKQDVGSVKKLMKNLPIEKNILFERNLVDTVTTPVLRGMKESRARGLILSVFDSVSSFGDSWASVPTRDATPLYVYFGPKIETDENPLDKCVRVDLRFLYGISKNLEGFRFYERRYKKDGHIEPKEIGKPAAWSIAVTETLAYDECLGVMESE